MFFSTLMVSKDDEPVVDWMGPRNVAPPSLENDTSPGTLVCGDWDLHRVSEAVVANANREGDSFFMLVGGVFFLL